MITHQSSPDIEHCAEEAGFLEDNIATVAFHLGQPGARMSVGYDGGSKLFVDPGEVLKEISRRLGVAQTGRTDLWACTGCGSQKTLEQIHGEHPGSISCCPERKMAPVSSTHGAGK